jgi:hypothetical protein
MFIMKLPHPTTDSKECFRWDTTSVYTCPTHNIALNDGSFQTLHKSSAGKKKIKIAAVVIEAMWNCQLVLENFPACLIINIVLFTSIDREI